MDHVALIIIVANNAISVQHCESKTQIHWHFSNFLVTANSNLVTYYTFILINKNVSTDI